MDLSTRVHHGESNPFSKIGVDTAENGASDCGVYLLPAILLPGWCKAPGLELAPRPLAPGVPQPHHADGPRLPSFRQKAQDALEAFVKFYEALKKEFGRSQSDE